MDTIESLTAERDQARAFAESAAQKYNEILASNKVTCAYCGHQYPYGTPEAKSAALTAHIAICEAHPMRQLGAALCGLLDLSFPPTDTALKEMRLGIATLSDFSPDDAKNGVAALDALRAFVPPESA